MIPLRQAVNFLDYKIKAAWPFRILWVCLNSFARSHISILSVWGGKGRKGLRREMRENLFKVHFAYTGHLPSTIKEVRTSHEDALLHDQLLIQNRCSSFAPKTALGEIFLSRVTSRPPR